MADWALIPCLKALFTAFNVVAPDRAKDSDGSIGDVAHRQSVSDHNPDEEGNVPIHDADSVNEVHAIDVDKDLNESDLTMEKVVQFLLIRCRSGAEKRLRYIIYNRRIWSASSDWVQKTYTGASPHTEHAHFSASYDPNHEANTASWYLEEIPVALTAADKTWIEDTIETKVKAEFDKYFKITKQGTTDYNTNEAGRRVTDYQAIPNKFLPPTADGKDAKTPLYLVLEDLQDAVIDIRGKVSAALSDS